jgi:hypothetical protein
MGTLRMATLYENGQRTEFLEQKGITIERAIDICNIHNLFRLGNEHIWLGFTPKDLKMGIYDRPRIAATFEEEKKGKVSK